MLKKKIKNFLFLFTPVSLGFLVSCKEPEVNIDISRLFEPIFEFPEKSNTFKKQEPRSFNLYVSEVNAIKLKWFLNKPSLMNLSSEEKNRIYASKVGKYYVFDNKNRILTFENKFNANEEINPNFLKKAFKKTADSYLDVQNNLDNKEEKIVDKTNNIEIYRKISKIFDPNWRFIEMKLVKPNIISDDKKNYILINAYKVFLTDPLNFSKKTEQKQTVPNKEKKETEKTNIKKITKNQVDKKTEQKETDKNQVEKDKNWRISAPNVRPTPVFRLHWYGHTLKDPFKVELNTTENVNSEYDLQMVNDINQPESVADFNFNPDDNKPKAPDQPSEIFHSKPFIRLVSQSFLIPFDGEVSDFESDEFKFKYQFK